ncbi:glycosyltransferase family 4 protein, partial [Candidatus Woesearchaeota archaeon]|nr:glycosyltransferase family 4 protein [Candidatus Woesearchaeota archaeon]
RPFGYLKALNQLKSHIKKNKFDIVHTHSSAAGILGRIAARLAKTPVIIHTVHGWGLQEGMSFMKKKIYLMLERFCAGFTDKIVCVSEADIKTGIEKKICRDRKKYAVIRSGIDVNKFSKQIDINKKKKELGINPEQIVIGTVGRLDKQKNPIDLLKAAKIVLNKNPNALFLFAGDGPLREKTEKLLKINNLNNFKILGFRNDVDELVHVFDMLVLTSLWEGLPRAVIEAMAAKNPVIANNVGGVREAVRDSFNGFVTQPYNHKQTAEKILFLLENPDKRNEMGLNGHKLVEEFSDTRMLQKIKELYLS